MDWKDIAGAVGSAAPILGGLLGGPAGAAVGGIVAHALGVGNSPSEIEHAIATDPEAAAKLRMLEETNKVELQRMAYAHAEALITADTARIQADVDDRKSARSREVDTKDTATPRTLAYAVTIGFFGVLFFLLYHGKPETGGDALLVMLGALGGAWGAIVSYYFGSSAGSDRKTELIAKTAPAAEPNASTGP